MSDRVLNRHGRRVLICAADGALLENERDAGDFLSLAWSREADLLALPVSRLGTEFFDLQSGIAGQIVQKFVNYRMPVAVLGDVSAWRRNSRAFMDFVREANRVRSFWFVADEAALWRILEPSGTV